MGMKMKTNIQIYWAALFALATACQHVDDAPFVEPQPEETAPAAERELRPYSAEWFEEQEFVIAPWVHQIRFSELQDVSIEADRLVFPRAGHERLEKVGVQDILWAPVGDPERTFGRRILEVRQDDGDFIFETEDVRIEEIFFKLDYELGDRELEKRILGYDPYAQYDLQSIFGDVSGWSGDSPQRQSLDLGTKGFTTDYAGVNISKKICRVRQRGSWVECPSDTKLTRLQGQLSAKPTLELHGDLYVRIIIGSFLGSNVWLNIKRKFSDNPPTVDECACISQHFNNDSGPDYTSMYAGRWMTLTTIHSDWNGSCQVGDRNGACVATESCDGLHEVVASSDGATGCENDPAHVQCCVPFVGTEQGVPTFESGNGGSHPISAPVDQWGQRIGVDGNWTRNHTLRSEPYGGFYNSWGIWIPEVHLPIAYENDYGTDSCMRQHPYEGHQSSEGECRTGMVLSDEDPDPLVGRRCVFPIQKNLTFAHWRMDLDLVIGRLHLNKAIDVHDYMNKVLGSGYPLSYQVGSTWLEWNVFGYNTNDFPPPNKWERIYELLDERKQKLQSWFIAYFRDMQGSCTGVPSEFTFHMGIRDSNFVVEDLGLKLSLAKGQEITSKKGRSTGPSSAGTGGPSAPSAAPSADPNQREDEYSLTLAYFPIGAFVTGKTKLAWKWYFEGTASLGITIPRLDIAFPDVEYRRKDRADQNRSETRHVNKKDGVEFKGLDDIKVTAEVSAAVTAKMGLQAEFKILGLTGPMAFFGAKGNVSGGIKLEADQGGAELSCPVGLKFGPVADIGIKGEEIRFFDEYLDLTKYLGYFDYSFTIFDGCDSQKNFDLDSLCWKKDYNLCEGIPTADYILITGEDGVEGMSPEGYELDTVQILSNEGEPWTPDLKDLEIEKFRVDGGPWITEGEDFKKLLPGNSEFGKCVADDWEKKVVVFHDNVLIKTKKPIKWTDRVKVWRQHFDSVYAGEEGALTCKPTGELKVELANMENETLIRGSAPLEVPSGEATALNFDFYVLDRNVPKP
jgi:hypothetical protein